MNEKFNPSDEIVILTVHDFAQLIRESERLAILLHFVENAEYCNVDDLRTIMGFEKKDGEK